MIKGSKAYIESEIDRFIQQQAGGEVRYQTEEGAAGGTLSHVLYLGCGHAEKPFYIFGLCSVNADKGGVVITGSFKPESYLKAFARLSIRLFPHAPLDFHGGLMTHFRTAYSAMLASFFERYDTVGTGQLAVFGDEAAIKRLTDHILFNPNRTSE